MELKPIQKVWLNHDNDLVDLTLTIAIKDAHGKVKQQQEVIHTNEKHPFLTKEKGFIPVSQLKPGMHVLEANGHYGIVAKLVVASGAMWMYNLTVAQDHTYAVGMIQWIVHNDNDPCTGTGTPGDNLPDRKPGEKTQGVLVNGDQQTDVISGKDVPASQMSSDVPGMDKRLWTSTHAEAHAAALMRLENMNDATLYLNNTPCDGDYGCDATLPYMIPEGSTLTVYYKDAVQGINEWVPKVYNGLPDSQWKPPPSLRNIR